MKPIVFVSAAALAAVFSIGAQAQTGRPADSEVGAQTVIHEASTNDEEVGSYARWLMLQGKPRDVAIAEARTFDHPAPVRKFAWHRATTPSTTTTTQQ